MRPILTFTLPYAIIKKKETERKNKVQQITDYNFYTKEMDKSLIDKLFFLPHLSPRVKYIVDFGCANGSLLSYIDSNFSYTLFGYDKDPKMIKECIGRDYHNQVIFTDNFNKLTDFLIVHARETAIVFSSVFHELFSQLYSNENDDLNKVFSLLEDTCPRTIVIRDMFWRKNEYVPRQIKNNILAAIGSTPYSNAFSQHLAQPFSHLTLKSYVHFFLKYRYTANWTREVTENYFSINENFFSRFNGYSPSYLNIFTLPFLVETVKKDFGINLAALPITTHFKLILEFNF